MSNQPGKIGVRWWVAIILWLSYIVWYMDRVNISVAGLIMIKEFGWTAADYGLVQSAFFVGYALTQIPGGWLADKFGG
ncbi:putative sulfoacetate transporter SauU [Sporomusa carbonis]